MARKKKRLRVRRRGYWRGPYTYRRRGKLIKVKRHYVPPTTFYIRDRGAPGRGRRVIGELEEEELRKHGYSVDKPARARRRALAKAVREDGAAKVWRRLHAQVIFRKGAPKGSKEARDRERFRKDRDWVKERYKPDLTPRAAIRAWRRMNPAERARRR